MDEVIREDASQTVGGFRIADFKDRPPWWGGDLQTLRNFFMAQSDPLPSTSTTLEFPTSDGSGDWLTGRLEHPLATGVVGPLILLIHGLTGCEDSTYVRASAQFHLARGPTVLRLNLRGAGPPKRAVKGYYHAGCAADIQDVLDGLSEEHTRHGIFVAYFPSNPFARARWTPKGEPLGPGWNSFEGSVPTPIPG
jgi:uncharacterized protein